ncbi:MAG: PHP domain-containing protein, partial [Planctomycetota bacterium]
MRRAAARRGVRAVLMTEHREALDDRGIVLAAERCRDLSDPEVMLVPGLETASDEGWHVLGFGQLDPVPKGPGVTMAERIRKANGYPVLAHPTRYRSGWRESLPGIGAVEVWNRHYDGRLGPQRLAVDAWLADRQARAVFGLDAHGPEALRGALPEMLVE